MGKQHGAHGSSKQLGQQNRGSRALLRAEALQELGCLELRCCGGDTAGMPGQLSFCRRGAAGAAGHLLPVLCLGVYICGSLGMAGTGT